MTKAPMMVIIAPIARGATNAPTRAVAPAKSTADTVIPITNLTVLELYVVTNIIIPTNNTNIKAINIAIYLPTLARDLLFSQDKIFIRQGLTHHTMYVALSMPCDAFLGRIASVWNSRAWSR